MKKIIIELTIAEAIMIYRKRKKITQKQLAELLGVSVSTVINLEKGKTIPDLILLQKLNIIFNFLK